VSYYLDKEENIMTQANDNGLLREIRTVNNALEWVKEVSEKLWKINSDHQYPVHLWFRGNRSQGHQLVPSIFRLQEEEQCPIKKISSYYVDIQPEESSKMYEEGGLYIHLINRLPEIRSEFPSVLDILSLFRHYELPCRLLDWTENVLIALWMASEDNNKDGELFALNARKLAETVDLPHQKRIPPNTTVYTTESLHVLLRTGMVRTSYLDELFALPFVREGFLGNGFSERFWEHLLKAVSLMKENDIGIIEGTENMEQTENIIDKIIKYINNPSNSLSHEDAKLYKLLYKEMPPLMKQQLHLYFDNSVPKEDIENLKKAQKARLWLFKFLFDLRKPVTVFPERRNIRLMAQSGMFTIGGGDFLVKKIKREGIECRIPRPLHLNRENKDIICVASIPQECKQSLRVELERIGIHAANVYPELESQGKYLKNLWYVDIDSSSVPG
jgi:hypothetical protein